MAPHIIDTRLKRDVDISLMKVNKIKPRKPDHETLGLHYTVLLQHHSFKSVLINLVFYRE